MTDSDRAVQDGPPMIDQAEVEREMIETGKPYGEVLGVLTGQVPVASMPIAMSEHPVSAEDIGLPDPDRAHLTTAGTLCWCEDEADADV